MSNVKPGAGLQLKSGEAIAVIGMRQRHRVHLQSGKVAGGAWHMRFANPEANVYPENTYIVVKLPALAGGDGSGEDALAGVGSQAFYEVGEERRRSM